MVELPPRYETVLLGICVYSFPEMEQPFRSLVRIHRDLERGTFHITPSPAAYESLEAAKAAATREATEVDWWESISGPEGEATCPICGAWNQGHMESRERHPHRICSVCELEASDEEGNALQFGNTTRLGGGFQAVRADTKEVVSGSFCYCWVRGKRCRAEEAHFGGIVMELCDPDEEEVKAPATHDIRKTTPGFSWRSFFRRRK